VAEAGAEKASRRPRARATQAVRAL
jgi:hypothetical protein